MNGPGAFKKVELAQNKSLRKIGADYYLGAKRVIRVLYGNSDKI